MNCDIALVSLALIFGIEWEPLACTVLQMSVHSSKKFFVLGNENLLFFLLELPNGRFSGSWHALHVREHFWGIVFKALAPLFLYFALTIVHNDGLDVVIAVKVYKARFVCNSSSQECSHVVFRRWVGVWNGGIWRPLLSPKGKSRMTHLIYTKLVWIITYSSAQCVSAAGQVAVTGGISIFTFGDVCLTNVHCAIRSIIVTTLLWRLDCEVVKVVADF